MIRTFIALELPEQELKKIIEIKNNCIKDYDKIKWEPINKLHLTLKFLGDTDETFIPEINSELEKILKNYEIFELTFDKFGLFIKDKKPRILWIGLKDNVKLNNLVQEIDNVVSQFGFEKEKRKFTPHITLLRIKDKDEKFYKDFYKLTQVEIPEINFKANKITFFKSTLLKTGSVYEPIKNFYIKNIGGENVTR
ncbi:RNA 2',3'-cyclic phosphodiesterase [Ignavibacteria bacterium 4148-Me]|uniref:RNA 2',3'-cyclic phosphodiesterase n=1 Tax=Rosettibacter primus TaxID=3111523 RepID=UPI00336C30A6